MKPLRLLVVCGLVGVFAGASADWIQATEPAPHNPRFNDEDAAAQQTETPVIPSSGSSDSLSRPTAPSISNDSGGADAIAKSNINGQQALAAAERTVSSPNRRKPWLLPVVGLGCAMLAVALVWRVRSWADKNAPHSHKH